MKLRTRRSLYVALGLAIFLVAFGVAFAAQDIFQVSRSVDTELDVFETIVLPDEQLGVHFKDGTPVEGLGFGQVLMQPPLRQLRRPSRREVYVTNMTDITTGAGIMEMHEPDGNGIFLRPIEPCGPAVREDMGEQVGHISAVMWNEHGREMGNTCDEEWPRDAMDGAGRDLEVHGLFPSQRRSAA